MMGFGALGEYPLGIGPQTAAAYADAGAYAIAGQAVDLRESKVLVAASGAVSLTGQPAALVHGYPLLAGPGAFGISGQAADFRATRTLPFAVGAMSVGGQVANLLYGHTTTFAGTSYVVTGQAAAPFYGRHIDADVRAYAIGGQAATFRATRIIPFAAGAYTITGQAVRLTSDHPLRAAAAAFVIGGQAAWFYYNRVVIRGGVSFPSYADQATYAVVTGSADPDFPISNLADLSSVRTPARAAAIGNFAFTAVLPAAVPLRAIGLLHHNASGPETIRVRFYSDAAMTALVDDSGVLPMFPTGAAPSTRYPQVRPHIISVPVTARAVRVDLAGNPAPWQIGAVEISHWWEWKDIAVPRELGIQSRDIIFEQPFDVDHVTSRWSPRVTRGSREVILQSENDTTNLDFIREKMLSRPFMYLWDFSDPSTWAREAMVVVNASLPPPSAREGDSGRMAYDFMEHMR